MTSPVWSSEERADLDATITAARAAGNEELAGYWQDIRDGRTPVIDWADVRGRGR